MRTIVVTTELIDRIGHRDAIRADFRSLTPSELEAMTKSVMAHGFVDPITLWPIKSAADPGMRVIGPDYVVVDGHHRLDLKRGKCAEHELRAVVIEFKTLADAIEYATDKQLGRRNINRHEMAYRRGKQYIENKRPPGPAPTMRQPPTAKQLAELYNVSQRTIKDDAAFFRGVEILHDAHGASTKADILSMKTDVLRKEIIAFGRGTMPVNKWPEIAERGQKPRQRRKKATPAELAERTIENVALLESANLSVAEREALLEILAAHLPQARDKIMIEKGQALLNLLSDNC